MFYFMFKGDVYSRLFNVEQILEDCALRKLQKAASKEVDVLNLSAMRLNNIPDISKVLAGLSAITDINLSRNNLFDGDQLFRVRFLFEIPGCAEKVKVIFPTGTWKPSNAEETEPVREFLKWSFITARWKFGVVRRTST